jgi:hypothetical protein
VTTSPVWRSIRVWAAVVAGYLGDLPDLLESGYFGGVVDERHALVVTGGVGEEQAVVGRQVLGYAAEAREVVVDLLQGDQVEPAQDLRDER